MQDFSYARATSRAEALALAAEGDTAILAGGTELLNWLRIGIAAPGRVVDISRTPGMDGVEALPGGGARIGALTRLNDAAQHPLIQHSYPVLSQAILKSASAQLRNLATIGGNPLQRVRCPYFRAEEPTPCNKRAPGSGCAALHGFNEKHAIFGWTEDCVAVQPSDPAAALAALDAVYVTERRDADGRRIPARSFHVLPSEDPTAHTVLEPGELIVSIEIAEPATRSAYLKLRERESYEYATVSAAVVLDLDGEVIRRARIALGSVAMRPWRLDEAERRLQGQRLGGPEVEAAVDAGFAEARPLSSNAYKIRLARNAVLRTLNLATRAS
ncbi:FAD binding domain-containing protein [Roseomonas sp. E05]|uniref:FAD binding domain-containing protein n=1 Tax=Roseomonas sp. E05 TaxID=3046310 RepID=UPI0024BB9610|nr:FAD binding domain-containing protein [Roseomonas sp. E05]MDJ0390222.1 FAD binding domain-containing protein [Roseomonas sp. E05]